MRKSTICPSNLSLASFMSPTSSAPQRIYVLADAEQKCGRRWDQQSGPSKSIQRAQACGRQLEIGSAPANRTTSSTKVRFCGSRRGPKPRFRQAGRASSDGGKLTSRKPSLRERDMLIVFLNGRKLSFDRKASCKKRACLCANNRLRVVRLCEFAFAFAHPDFVRPRSCSRLYFPKMIDPIATFDNCSRL